MCIFRFRCGILSSGRGSRGRLARFLDVRPSVCVSSVSGKGDDFEDLLLAVVRTRLWLPRPKPKPKRSQSARQL